MNFGIDVGSYSTKGSKGISFLSKVSKECDLNEKADYIEIDKERWYLGEGDFDVEYRKSERKSYITLLYACIGLMTDDIRNNIVVGLPLSQYKEDKEYLRNRILQNANKEIIINDVEKRISINDVEVVPEGVAAVEEDFEGIVIDVGGRTTDICLVSIENNRKKIKKPYSLPIGALNLENDFIRMINNYYGLDLFPGDAPRILSKGLRIYGEEKTTDFAIEVYKEFVNKVVNILKVDYPVSTYDSILIGGGATSLYNSFRKRIPNLQLSDAGYWGNAIGYEQIAKEIWD